MFDIKARLKKEVPKNMLLTLGVFVVPAGMMLTGQDVSSLKGGYWIYLALYVGINAFMTGFIWGLMTAMNRSELKNEEAFTAE